MTKWITEDQITAAAKAECCPDCDCVPSASYCEIKHGRDRIRRMLAASARVDGETGDGK